MISIIGLFVKSGAPPSEPELTQTPDSIVHNNTGALLGSYETGPPSDDGNNTAYRMIELESQQIYELNLFGMTLPITFAHVTGILGIIITVLKTLAKYLNWNSRSDMHETASTTLIDVFDDLITTRNEVEVLCDENDFIELIEEYGEKKETYMTIEEIEFNYRKSMNRFGDPIRKLNDTKAKFNTMQKSCTDPIPPEIMTAFVEIQEVFACASYDDRMM